MEIVRTEAKTFLENLALACCDENTRWINSIDRAMVANWKLNQLLLARRLGFLVPETYAGNDPVHVREMLARNGNRIIYKAFECNVWENEDGSKTHTRTAAISAEHVQDFEAIAACPGIFQQLIHKDYEIRAAVIGTEVHAVAIYSQAHSETIDWRCELGFNAPMNRIDLPSEIKALCIELCMELGIHVGFFDLIVTKSGEYYFLEVNEAGLFLAMERICPQLGVLDSLCHYLADRPRKDRPRDPIITVHDWDALQF